MHKKLSKTKSSVFVSIVLERDVLFGVSEGCIVWCI